VWQHGQTIVELDGIYKHTKLGWPIWSLVVEDDLSHLWPIGTIIASSGSTGVLLHGLCILQQHVKIEISGEWDPLYD
jgi:hypothetical protein